MDPGTGPGRGVEAANRIARSIWSCVDDPFALLPWSKTPAAFFCHRQRRWGLFAGPNHTLPTSGTARFQSPQRRRLCEEDPVHLLHRRRCRRRPDRGLCRAEASTPRPVWVLSRTEEKESDPMSRWISQEAERLALHFGEQPQDQQYVKLNTNESPSHCPRFSGHQLGGDPETEPVLTPPVPR
ncbi:MAG: hypothetical protein ACLTYN_05050 [Dysosmobacter welbionis]